VFDSGNWQKIMQVTIYHNPRCSKSRATLQLLSDRGIEPRVVEYLKTPPTAEDLAGLVRALGTDASSLLRTGEAEYAEAGLGEAGVDDAAILRAIAKHPKLLQRPIVLVGDQARIGRPPERVLEILP
jgi:arsenate reductase